MLEATVLRTGAITVVDYRCSAGPADPSFPECHSALSLSFVRRGSFGYRCGGQAHELVAGAVMLGHPGAEYTCTHDHHDGGDDCLSFRFAPQAFDDLDGAADRWRAGALPPIPRLMVLGELACASAHGHCDIGADEAGLLMASQCLALATDRAVRPPGMRRGDRQRAVEAALWVDAHAHEPDIGLERLAGLAGLSPFHFLRLFSKVLGVTPHQYVVRSRLRRAGRMLVEDERPITQVALDAGFEDLSHFVRMFHRAAGMSPGAFRRTARGHRKNLQACPPPFRGA